MSRRVLLVAGEASGDVHAADLIRELRAEDPSIEVRGMAGSEARRAGMEVLVDARVVATMGLTEVLTKRRELWSTWKTLKKEIRDGRPDLLVLIDFPEFNLALARIAKRCGVPVFYYVSPQVWAWRRGRVRKILRRVDRLAAIFPFEREVYRNSPKVEFIGHPLLDRAKAMKSREEVRATEGVREGEALVTLLPGSREKEIEALLPPMLEAVRRLRGSHAIACRIALASTIDEQVIEEKLASTGVEASLGVAGTYDLVAASDCVLTSSGTATLETAILETPMVLMYCVSRTTYAIAKRVVKVPYIGMPNVIAGREIVPELIQDEVVPARIAEETDRILRDAAVRERMKEDLRAVRQSLGEPGAAARAARLARELMT